MREWIDLCEQAFAVEEHGMGMRTYQNDEIALGGGIRSGSSPAGYTRLLYIIYDVKAFAAGTPQDECELGKVEVWGRDGSQQIDGLVNIEVNKSARRGGWGAKVIKSLVDTCPVHFHISDIKKGAISFWAAQGTIFFAGTKRLTTAEARKYKYLVNGVIPKEGCSDPVENYAALNRGKA